MQDNNINFEIYFSMLLKQQSVYFFPLQYYFVRGNIEPWHNEKKQSEEEQTFVFEMEKRKKEADFNEKLKLHLSQHNWRK